MAKILLYRDVIVGNWMASYEDAIDTVLPYTIYEKAGDVAAKVASANPEAQIGILSIDIGPALARNVPVVWMKKGWRGQ